MKKIAIIFIITIMSCAAGYEGILPDIEADFEYKRKSTTVKVPENSQLPSNENELKKTPENVEYINIIMKKDKTSEYETDAKMLLQILEKLKVYMEDNAPVQMFNACVSNYIDHAAYIQTKYKGKPEEYYVSFRAAMAFAQATADVAVKKTSGITYSPYLPYSGAGSEYSELNIKKADELLLKQLYDTLYVLKNLE